MDAAQECSLGSGLAHPIGEEAAQHQTTSTIPVVVDSGDQLKAACFHNPGFIIYFIFFLFMF